jgi:hypothetical protein
MSWLQKLAILLKISDRSGQDPNRTYNSKEPKQDYSLTEKDPKILKDNVEDTIVSSEPRSDKMLNSEPHDDTNDEILKMFWNEGQPEHLFNEPLDKANVITDANTVNPINKPPTYDLVGSSQENEEDRKFNLISKKVDCIITLEQLSEENPTLAEYLSGFGVKTLDKTVVASTYHKLCVEAARQEKPLSEVLKRV